MSDEGETLASGYAREGARKRCAPMVYPLNRTWKPSALRRTRSKINTKNVHVRRQASGPNVMARSATFWAWPIEERESTSGRFRTIAEQSGRRETPHECERDSVSSTGEPNACT